MSNLPIQRKLLLGTASNPRKEIIRNIGIPFSIRISNSQENNPKVSENINKIAAQNIVLQNARNKQKALLESLTKEDKQEYFGVLTADTIIWLPPNNFISKPYSKDEARKIFELLSENSHTVYSALVYTPINQNQSIGKTFSCFGSCKVFFNKIPIALLNKYLDSGMAEMFAGGYNIQGVPSTFVSKIEGDYFTVVGLPVNKWFNTLYEKNKDNYLELISTIDFSAKISEISKNDLRE